MQDDEAPVGTRDELVQHPDCPTCGDPGVAVTERADGLIVMACRTHPRERDRWVTARHEADVPLPENAGKVRSALRLDGV